MTQRTGSLPAPVDLVLGGYTDDQPEESSGLARVKLGGGDEDAPARVAPVPDPSWVVRLPDGRLAMVSEAGDEVALVSGAGDELSRCGSGGMGPAHLAASPDARWLVASNYVSGSVGLIALDDDGLRLVDELQLEGEGPHERQDSAHAHQAVWLDDTRMLVCDLGADRVHETSLEVTDDGDGELRHTGQIELPAGAGPRHLALHPGRDDVAWVVGELDLAVHVLRRGEEGWAVTGSASSAPSGPADGETTAAGIVVAPDGGHVYVSTRGTDTVVVFAVDEDGGLELVQLLTVDHWPRFIGWAPGSEGEVLLVAAERAGTVQARLVEDGRLGEVAAQVDWSAPTWAG